MMGHLFQLMTRGWVISKQKTLGEDISPSFTALFKNAQTLKFNSNRCLFAAVNHLSGPLKKKN